jgi:hypothetical protein
MARQVAVALYLVAMAAVTGGVDFAFFRQGFRKRLTVNIDIVLVFAAFYADSSAIHEQSAIVPVCVRCADARSF